MERQVDHPQIQETRTVALLQAVSHGRQGGLVRGRRRMCPVSMTDSTSEGLSRTVTENDGNHENAEGEGSASTKTGDLEKMPSGFQPVRTQNPIVRMLPTPIPNKVHHSFAQGLDVQSDVLVGERSRDDEFERVEDESYCLLEELNTYKIEKENLENTLLEKRVVMKGMTQSLVDLERPANMW